MISRLCTPLVGLTPTNSVGASPESTGSGLTQPPHAVRSAPMKTWLGWLSQLMIIARLPFNYNCLQPGRLAM
ncbi:hypothetical protein BDW66DRAFT_141047, partial [Aspergillus desertorum]